ncbi:MAG: DUF455 family protein [Bdellovibrionota bacterium]
MEIREFAEMILFSTSIEDKLFQPEASLGLNDENPGLAISIPTFPGRPQCLSLNSRHDQKNTDIRFPGKGQFHKAIVRGQALHFFANHELLAMELMALVLLRFPNASKSFRRGIVRTIYEEQKHLRLYISRMSELSVTFGDIGVNSFFWNSLKGIKSPLDYTIKMSMTFEQANLDYSRYYEEVFSSVGDIRTAELMQTVYKEEIGHVKYGLEWFRRLKDPSLTEWQAYKKGLEFPLSPSRGKGMIFDKNARVQAGMSNDFIDRMQLFSQSKGRPPVVRFFNLQSEQSCFSDMDFSANNRIVSELEKDDSLLMMYLGNSSDIVLLPQLPRDLFLSELQKCGFTLPQFLTWDKNEKFVFPASLKTRKIAEIDPWAMTPRLQYVLNKNITCNYPAVVSKEYSVTLNKKLCNSILMKSPLIGGDEMYAVVVRDEEELIKQINDLSQYTGSVVIKAPYGSSGRNMIRCRSYGGLDLQYKNWLSKTLNLYSCLIVEPWLKKVADLSILLRVKEDHVELNGITRFFTTTNGQYCGHYLRCRDGQIPSFLLATIGKEYGYGSEHIYNQLDEIGNFVGRALMDAQYQGPAGVDCIFYQDVGNINKYYLKPIVETNLRYTMGHVAQQMTKRVVANKNAIWRHFSLPELRKIGFSSFEDFATYCYEKYPVQIKSTPNPLIESGVLFTTDPKQTSSIITFIHVYTDGSPWES